MRTPLKTGKKVKTNTDAVYAQSSLNNRIGTVHKDNGDNDIIVNIHGFGLIQFSINELIPL